MTVTFIHFAILMIPSMLLMSLGVFIYTRSHQSVEVRLASLLALCYAAGLAMEYLRHITPFAWGGILLKLILIVTLLGLTLNLHVIFYLLYKQKRVYWKSAPYIFYVPVAVLVVAAIVTGKISEGSFYMQGYWIHATTNALMILSYLLNGVVCVALLITLVAGYKKSTIKSYRHMFLFFIVGTVCLAIICLILKRQFLPLPMSTQLLIPATLSAIILVIGMVLYGLSPSFASRYQLMLNLTPVAVFVYDEQLQLKEFNKLAVKMVPNLQKQSYFYDLFTQDSHMVDVTKLVQSLQREKLLTDYQLTFNEQTADALHIAIDAAVVRVGDEHLYYMIVRDITEMVVQERKNYYLAYHDVLTGLHNRSYFVPFVTSHLHRAQQSGLILSDLNFFKHINDTYGHAVGDDVLKFTANVIYETVGEHCVVARLGGDEFVMYFEHIERPAQMLTHIEALRIAFQTTIFTQGDIELEVVPSFGYACYPQYTYFEALFHAADLNMYEDKRRIKAHYQR